MTTTNSLPKTAAQAKQFLDGLQRKSAALAATVSGFERRRRQNAVKSELGDEAAIAELRDIGPEEAQARTNLRNVTVAIEEMTARHAEMLREEQSVAFADRERRMEAAVDVAIDELLALDDKIDACLDQARGLLAERIALIESRNNEGGRRLPGVAASERSVGETLMDYFDSYNAYMRNRGDYRRVARFAELDAKQVGKASPAMLRREPAAIDGWRADALHDRAHAFSPVGQRPRAAVEIVAGSPQPLWRAKKDTAYGPSLIALKDSTIRWHENPGVNFAPANAAAEEIHG